MEKFSGEARGSSDGPAQDGSKSREYMHIQGLKSKIVNQVRNLAAEAGGKGSAKKDLNNQRNLFRDILEYLEVNMSVFFRSILDRYVTGLYLTGRLLPRSLP